MLPLKPERKVFWGGPYVESRELLSRWAIFGRYDDVETIREVLKARKMPVRFLPECEILTEEERRLWQAENCRIQDSGEQDKEIPEICVNSGNNMPHWMKLNRRIPWYLYLENMRHSQVKPRAGHFLICRKGSRSF